MPDKVFSLYEQVRDYIDHTTRDLYPSERREFLEILEADVEMRKAIAHTLVE